MPRRRRKPPVLHELESEVMEEIWRRDEATVRQVLDALNRGPKQRAYTTVMTIMTRLDEKGLLTRRRVGKTDVYRPVMSRDEYLDSRAELEVEDLVRQFGDHALVHFSQQMARLDPQQLARLRKLAEDG